jgi:hypothetical protein
VAAHGHDGGGVMIAIADVRTALVNAIQAAVYPNGTSQPSISNTPIKIFAGWPASADLNADLGLGKTDISVFPKPEGRNTTRYPEDAKVLVAAAPTLTLTVGTAADILAEDGGRLLGEDGTPMEAEQVDSQVVTVGGTVSVPQNVGLLVNRRPYAYAVQPYDTLAYIAGSLAALVGEDVPGTTVNGTSIMVGPTGRIQALRVGASATMGTEVRRQERVVMITVWAPTPALRDEIGAALDVALAQIQFLDLPYDYGARLIYKSDNQADVTQKQTLYRWDFNYLVEYPTVVIAAAPQVLFPATDLATQLTPIETLYI